MSNYPFIVLPEPIQLDLNQVKENKVSTTNTTEKPKINIGNLEIELEINKGSDRFIITKKYNGSKLFYKMHRRACSAYLSKGTHFNSQKEAQDHFDSFIKSNWKHTKQFQIEPVSNFFISDWRLVTDYNSYSSSYDLAEKQKVILKNVPISIDDYKRGKKVTTVQELLKRFIDENEKHKQWNEKTIADYERQLINTQNEIKNYQSKIADRNSKLANLLQHDNTIAELIEQNTTEAERTVKLFYGKEE